MIGPRTIEFEIARMNPLNKITASDVPRGLDPEDVAIDCSVVSAPIEVIRSSQQQSVPSTHRRRT